MAVGPAPLAAAWSGVPLGLLELALGGHLWDAAKPELLKPLLLHCSLSVKLEMEVQERESCLLPTVTEMKSRPYLQNEMRSGFE